MQSNGLILSFLLKCPSVLSTTLFPGSTTVVNLKPETFNSFVVKSKNHWAVDLYADWCGHCQAFAPKWENIAYKHGKKKTGKIIFGALNCADHYDFCEGLGVEAFPDLRVWHFPDSTESEQTAGYKIPVPPIEAQVDEWFAKQASKLSSISNLTGVVGDYNESAPPPVQGYREELPSELTLHHRFHDAEVALLYALRQGVFLQSEKVVIKGETKSLLKSEVLTYLLAFLDSLSIQFPSPQACADLSSLAEKVQRSVRDSKHGSLEYTEWSSILDSFSLDGLPPEAGTKPNNFLRLCHTYTCGLWTLFHIVTLAPSPEEGANSSVRSGEFINNPLLMIRSFVVHFLGCSSCVDHFMYIYDGCFLDRCQESPAGPQVDAALWLWRVHNNVTIRVATERNLTILSNWPSEKICPSCWIDGASESVATYRFLRSSYWHEDWTPGGASNNSQQNTTSSAIFAFVLIGALFCVIICLAYVWNRRAISSTLSKRSQRFVAHHGRSPSSPFLEDAAEQELCAIQVQENKPDGKQEHIIHDKSI